MKQLTFACLFALCSCWAGTVLATPPKVARFALVIGNNRPSVAGTAELKYADDDAVSTHRMLRDAGVHSLLLVNLDSDSQGLFGEKDAFAAPRASELERAFAELEKHMHAERQKGVQSELFFFYSGHGDVEHGEGFLALEDEKLTRSKLFALLSRSPAAHNHVFIDACKSYFLAFDRGPGGQRRPYQGAMMARLPAQLENTGFVLSTSSDRESHEWERYQGGILSHELRSALRGAADTNLDAHINYAELGAFLASANQGIKNPRFRPDFMVRPPGKNAQKDVLAWPGERAPLTLGETPLGHFYVETGSGERILDAHPTQGQVLKLWPPAERPLFVRKSDGSAEYVLTEQAPVKPVELLPTHQQVASRGAISLAFEQLFTVPFGERDVRQFRITPFMTDDSYSFDESRRRYRLRVASGVVALTGLAAGLTLSGLALTRYLKTADESQLEIKRENANIEKFNLLSVGGYALFAGSAAVWAWLRFWPERGPSFTPTLSRAGEPMLHLRMKL
jgi:hypothetical protein